MNKILLQNIKEILLIVIPISSLFANLYYGHYQMKMNKDANNLPRLQILSCVEKREEKYLNYELRKDKTKVIDKYYTIEMKNVGKGLLKSIQIYSCDFIVDNNPLKLDIYPSNQDKIIKDIDIQENEEENLNFAFSFEEISKLNKNNLLFVISYKNIYNDIFVSILNIEFNNNFEDIKRMAFFNEKDDGYCTLINNIDKKIYIKYIKDNSKNTNWNLN